MTTVADWSQRLAVQPLCVALLARVSQLVGPNLLRGLASAHGPRTSAAAYEVSWRVLRLALSVDAAQLEAKLDDQPNGRALLLLRRWFGSPSPQLMIELGRAIPASFEMAAPLSALRAEPTTQPFLHWEFSPELFASTAPSDHALLSQLRALELPELASHLSAPDRVERLVCILAWLLQALWERAGIRAEVTWPAIPEPHDETLPEQLWTLGLEGEDFAALIERLITRSGSARRRPAAPKPLEFDLPLRVPFAAQPPHDPAPPRSRGMSFGDLHEVSSRGPAALAPAPAAADEVRFTVYRPRALRPARWSRLLAFAHRSERPADAPADEPDPLEMVERQASAILANELSAYRQLAEDAASAVPFEARLDFVPDIHGVEFEPEFASFRWVGDVHRAEFRMRASAALAGQTARGALRVLFGQIVLAEITLSLKVEESATDEPAVMRDTARMYRKIFASYSHADSTIVEQFRELAKALGDRYLIDVGDLRAGERWSLALQRLIREADVFQLFWSWNSLQSTFVRQEWEYALSLGRPNFLRPTYWEKPFPEADGLPTQALRALHFQHVRAVPTFAPAPHAASPVPGSTAVVPKSQPTAAAAAAPAAPPEHAFADPQRSAAASPPRRKTRALMTVAGVVTSALVVMLTLRSTMTSTAPLPVPTAQMPSGAHEPVTAEPPAPSPTRPEVTPVAPSAGQVLPSLPTPHQHSMPIERPSAPSTTESSQFPSTDAVRAVVQQMKPRIARVCAKGARGTALIELKIRGASGSVEDISVSGVSPAIAACITREVRRARFPEFTAERFAVRLPIELVESDYGF